MRYYIFVSILLILAGCTQNDNKNPSPVGTWHGEIYKPEKSYLFKWKQENKQDGFYLAKFERHYKNGEITRFEEQGKWWIKDGLYHEIIPDLMREPDVYKIHLMNGEYFIIQSISLDEGTLSPTGKIYIHKHG